jgi:hypothetical protein
VINVSPVSWEQKKERKTNTRIPQTQITQENKRKREKI